jgi:hypothetical protein
MKGFKKICLLCVTISFVIGSFYSWGWAQSDSTKDELNILDLFFARPFGIVAGIVGTSFFIVTLPFTIPTNSVEKAANIFIAEPFKFSFVREFPDENI